MALRVYHVDAFTDRPFGGNPAAVCLLDRPRPDEWMQAFASEMNLSETAFLLRQNNEYILRWFTPSIEVDLCGHATLGSAHILWEEGILTHSEQARFQTRSGLLTADRSGDWIEMDFPAVPESPASAPPDLLDGLGAEAQYVGKNIYDYLVEVKSVECLRSLAPDFARLRNIPMRGVIVTTRSDDGHFDFVSRFFAPGAGIDEDPVTGSAHCCLGPFWQSRLGKLAMLAHQASKRGGVVRIRVEGDRVHLGGQAVTVLRGEAIG